MRRYEAISVEQLEDGVRSADARPAPLRPLDSDVSSSAYEHAASPLRPVNYRLFVALLVMSAASTGIVVWQHERQMQRMSNVFYERAEQARASGDLQATAGNLRRYLKIRSGDLDAQASLAIALDDLAETPREKFQVLLMMERLLRADSERREVRRRLVDLAMSFGRFHDASVHLKYLLHSTPKDAEMRQLLGRCYEAEGRYLEAVAEYETAVEQRPRQLDVYERLARLFSEELQQPEQADRIVDRMVAVNRNTASAHLARARYKLKQGLIKHALIDARRAYDLEPTAPKVLTECAGMLVAQSGRSTVATYFDAETIRRQLEYAVQSNPGDVDIYRALAQLDLLEGRAVSAEPRLRQALELAPKRIDLMQILTDVLIAQGRHDEAVEEIEHLRNRKFVPELITYLEARLSMAAEDWLVAARSLESIRTSSVHNVAFEHQLESHLGRCYAQLGLSERRLEALRKAMVLDELSTSARIELAEALVSMGRLDEAVAQYRQAGDDPAVLLELARLSYYGNLRLPPENRRWNEIETLLERGGVVPSQRHRALALRAHILAAQGRKGEALSLLEQACRREPGRVELWVAWAELAQQTEQPTDAWTILEHARQSLGQTPELFLARARYWLRIGDDAARRALLAMDAERKDYPIDAQPQLLRGLAQAYEAIAELEQAEQLWRELAQKTPNDLRVWRRLLERALKDGSDEKAAAVVAEMQRIEGADGAYWRLADAARHLMLAEAGGGFHTEQARRLLLEADKQLPASPRIPLGFAELSEREGKPDAAIDHYLDAVERGENRVQIVERVVRLAYERGRYRDAHHVIDRFHAPEAALPGGEFGRLVSAVELHADNIDRALDLARRALEEEGADVTDRLWLGHVLWKAGRSDEAEAEFRAALRQDSARPQCWVALVHFLAQAGEIQQAAAAIERAVDYLPEKDTPATLAQCYEAVGRPAEAERYHQAALSTAPNDVEILRTTADFYIRSRQFDKAEPLLRRLIDPKTGATARNSAAARRSLALILLSRGTYQSQREAAELVEHNLNAGGGTAADLRVKAKLLAARPSRKLRREAVAILETLHEREPLRAADLRLLTQLYLALNNWPQARDSLLSLMFGHSENPDLLEFAVRTMLDHGEAKGVTEQWLEDLKKREPNSYRTQELAARRLIADHQYDAGLDRLKQTLDGMRNREEEDRRRRRTADVLAELAESLDLAGRTLVADKFAQEAESLYRRLAQDRPDAALDLVRFLGARWRLAEAFRLLDQAWSVHPPETVAATLVALLRTGKADQEQLAHARERLNQALDAKPTSAALWFQAASVAQFAGDYAAAVDGYRKAIEHNPRMAAAHNELALLLALEGRDLDAALNSIDRAIASAGPLAELLDTRAIVLWKQGRNVDALRDLQAAVAHVPSAAVYYHLAQVQLAKDDGVAAQAAFQRAVAMGVHVEELHPLERDEFADVKSRMEKLKSAPPAEESVFREAVAAE